MGCFEDGKPVIAMLVLQFIFAGVTVSTRAAIAEGMSPRVFVVYSQTVAALVMAPVAYFSSRKKATSAALGLKNFSLMFLASLVGITVTHNFYFEGISLTSSSIASAMTNLLPAVTFVLAASLGLEKVNISARSMAKIMGTIICVLGAATMALLKGPKLLNKESPIPRSLFHSRNENWVLGCIYLFGSSCCCSLWMILQVPMSVSYPDHISLSAWMCFFASLQSGTLTYFLEPDPRAWQFDSSIKIFCCFYSGIAGSGLAVFVLSWCISKRGPLFSAMFSPLCTVIVTISACLVLHEELYIGSLAGAIVVVAGLYAVLWGKATDLHSTSQREDAVNTKSSTDQTTQSTKTDLEAPLLT